MGEMIMNRKQKDQYLQSNGNVCPYCESKTLDTGDFETFDDHIEQAVMCEDCQRNWTDHYKLADVVPEIGVDHVIDEMYKNPDYSKTVKQIMEIYFNDHPDRLTHWHGKIIEEENNHE